MNKYTSVLAMAAAAIGLLGAPAASAFVLGGTYDGEEAFGGLNATIDVAAEGRIGDLSGRAEHEFNIHYDNISGGQTVPTEYRRFDWVSGVVTKCPKTYTSLIFGRKVSTSGLILRNKKLTNFRILTGHSGVGLWLEL